MASEDSAKTQAVQNNPFKVPDDYHMLQEQERLAKQTVRTFAPFPWALPQLQYTPHANFIFRILSRSLSLRALSRTAAQGIADG